MKTKKLINCPQCGGFGFTSTPVSSDYKITVCSGKTCELCHGAGVIEAPMTNADRIRAMEGEKLAGFLAGVAGDKIGGTAKYWLQWLQQPAEEDDHVV